MIPFRRLLFPRIFKLFDLAALALTFVGAIIAGAHEFPASSLKAFLAMRISVRNFVLFLAYLFVAYLVFMLLGLYEQDHYRKLRPQLSGVLKGVAIITALLACLGPPLDIAVLNGAFFLRFAAASALLLTAGRIVLCTIVARSRPAECNLRQLLIVGTNDRAVQFADKLKANPELGYRLLGFVDDGWQARSSRFQQNGYRIVASLDKLGEYFKENVVDEVLICLPIRSCYEQISEVIRLCEDQGIVVRLSSDFFSLRLARSRAEQLGSETVITIYTGAMTGFPVIVKRALDIVVSATALAALSPIFILIAAAIKLTSPGPIFFVQERVGLNKRKFRMYKFRTMVPGADKLVDELEHLNEVSGPVFKIRNDPRVTPIGKILRKTSLDELPQLFNVLKGDMSLVGPRPLPVRDYEGFDKDWHRRRFSVRPGMTCLWQVNGRSEIPFEKWMELDLQYIDQWSLWLDIKILAKTIPAVFKQKGAA